MKWQTALQIILILVGAGILLHRRYLIKKCSIRVSAIIEDIEADASINSNLKKYHPNYATYKYKVEHWWYTERS